jgi:polyferredoxin
LRWAIQVSFLALFVVLLWRSRYGVSPVLGDIFFRTDPLVLLVGSVTMRAVITTALLALLLVGATLVFGRFFCGYICPLGTLIDLFDTLRWRRCPPGSRLRNVKFLVLLGLVIAGLAGTSLIHFFDPLVILERALARVFFPVGTHSGSNAVRFFPGPFMALAMVIVILGLSLIRPRFWCRNLCPLGAVYALLARVSWLRFRVQDACADCARCARSCPTGAFREDGEIDAGECIACRDCQFVCRHGTILYQRAGRADHFDAGRREAIAALGVGLAAVPLGLAVARTETGQRVLRPPGALPEREFLATCLRCARCMKACPTGTLQPCHFSAGPNAIWSPRVVPRIGACERNCNLCGQVCPTRAIRPLTLEEKSYAKLGTACINPPRCLAWGERRDCLICDEACPYNAIRAVAVSPGSRVLGPEVITDACVGCGACELRCPVAGVAAIRVVPTGEERRRTGSYKTPSRVQFRCGQSPQDEVPAGFQ